MVLRAARRVFRNGYVLATLSTAAATAVFVLGRDDFAKGQWALLYILIVLIVASGAGTGPAVLAAALSFLAWDFYFLPPYDTLYVSDPKDWLALAAFLIVGVIVGLQTGRMREREARAVARERETAALNRLSAQLVSEPSTEAMSQAAFAEIESVLHATSADLYLADATGLHSYRAGAGRGVADPAALEQAEWVVRNERPSGLPDAGRHGGTQPAAPGSGAVFLPLRSQSGTSGVLVVGPRTDGHPYGAVDARLMGAIANLVGVFLERRTLQEVAAQAQAAREADRLKAGLLSSVSHELKTPLAALTATVSNLLESDVKWDEESVRNELQAIVGDTIRLNNSISELLDLSRLEAHAWEPVLEPYDLADIVAAHLEALPAYERGRLRVLLPEDLPPIEVDYAQWLRVVQNLVENALLYAGRDALVTLGADRTERGTRMWVEDDGRGIPPDERDQVFERFFRGQSSGSEAPSGTGLGLTITREIVRAHGGTIHLEDVHPQGARFVITLPDAGGD